MTTSKGPDNGCEILDVNNGAVIIDRDKLDAPRSYIVSQLRGSIAFGIDGDVVRTLCGTRTINDGLWHSVAVGRTGNRMYIDIDGASDMMGMSPTSDIRCLSESTKGDCDLVIGQEKWGFESSSNFVGSLRNLVLIGEDGVPIKLF